MEKTKKVSLDYFLVPKELENRGLNGHLEEELLTKDKVWIKRLDELNLSVVDSDERKKNATDLVRVSNSQINENSHDVFGRFGLYDYWQRDLFSSFEKSNSFIDTYSNARNGDVFNSYGISPCINLDIEKILKAKAQNKDFFEIKEKIDMNKNSHYVVEFGEFPQSVIDNLADIKTNILFGTNKYEKTNKTYTIYCNNKEYEYQEYNNNDTNERFVEAQLLNITNDWCNNFSNGTKIVYNDGTLSNDVYIKVEPITWKITNYDKLPKELNPNGDGTAKVIELETLDIITKMPFFKDEDMAKSSNKSKLWQNSTIRGYLNSINVNGCLNNGTYKYSIIGIGGGDYEGKGFIDEAFKNTFVKMKENVENENNSNKKNRLQQLNPNYNQENVRRMTDTEMIKTWIDNGESVLLRGPSGIGKTDRIKKLYPDLIYIKLTNNMFPEKVVGSMNLQTGQAIPPEFVKTALLSEANEEEKKLINENIQNIYELADKIFERSKNSDKKVVILLDELLNVKPAVQSLVYTLVLNKLVETGKGLKLPANTVIVATGNQKKYSSVAQDLAEPLEKRFDHILDMEPKVGEWLEEYAIPNKIHPMVVGYIFSKYQQTKKSENKSKIGYFYEEPEVGEKNKDKYGSNGRTNDPRSWVSVSNMLYAFEEDLQNGKFADRNAEHFLRNSLETKLRQEWAAEFFDFYNKEMYTVEDIVNGDYDLNQKAENISDEFAQMANLLPANINEVEKIRDFIRNYCSPEYVSVFDIYWAGDDLERIEKLEELKELDKQKFAKVSNFGEEVKQEMENEYNERTL